MKLIYTFTQEEFEAEIIEVAEAELSGIKKSRRFLFDWSKEKDKHIFKIVKVNDDSKEILGLVSLINIQEEFRIHVNLLEVSEENKGKAKKVDRIAG